MWKKTIALLLVLMFALSFSGCGEEVAPTGLSSASSSEKSETSSKAQNVSSQPESRPEPVPDETDESFPVENGPINGYFDNTFVSDGTDVYYLTKISNANYEIRIIKPDKEDITVVAMARDYCDCLAVGEGKLFFYAMNYSTNENGLYSYDITTGEETFLLATAGILHLWYVDGWLYYSTVLRTQEGLRRCRPDGSGETKISDSPDDYFFFYQDWVYATDGHGHSLRVNLETLEQEDVDDSKSFVKFLYKGEFVYNQNGKEFNTDGVTLFVGTENGLYSTRSQNHPEDVLLYDKKSDSGPGASVYHIHVCGDYIIFMTTGDHIWHVVLKDGTYVKNLDKTDYRP